MTICKCTYTSPFLKPNPIDKVKINEKLKLELENYQQGC